VSVLFELEKELAVANDTYNRLTNKQGRTRKIKERIIYQGGYIAAMRTAVWKAKEQQQIDEDE
jgi:hypothetical protein